MNRSDQPAVDGIDTSQYYVVRKGEYDDMEARIERLQEQLADAHDMINNMTEHIYRIHRTIQEAHNDPN